MSGGAFNPSQWGRKVAAGVTAVAIASGVLWWATGQGSAPAAKCFVSSPVSAATLTGTVALTATCTSSVASEQFKVDGANVGAPVTSAPFSTSLDSTILSNAAHLITAVAADAAGDTTTSSAVAVTSSNGDGGGTVANLWVDTNGGTCTRSAPAAYVDAAACGSLQAAYTAASPGDLILVESGTYPTVQTVINGSSPKAAPAITIECQTVLACDMAGGISLAQTTNCGCVSGSAPSNIVIDGFLTTSLGASTYNSGYQPTNITLENTRVVHNLSSGVEDGSTGYCLTSSVCGGAGIVFNGIDHPTLTNDEIGPLCCVYDGIRFQASAGFGSTNVTVNGLYDHDVYNSCTEEPSSITDVYPCSGYGIGDGCNGNGTPPAGDSQCEHVDAWQSAGIAGLLLENSKFLAAGNQTVFLSCYGTGGGAYSNVAIVNNEVSNRATAIGGGSGFSFGNACSSVSGYVHFYYNTIQQQFHLYGVSSAEGGRPVSGTDYQLVGNIIGSNSPCTLQDTTGATFNPVWDNNEFGSGACSGTGNITGTATFVSSTYPYNLDLSGAQSAIDGGEASVCGPGKAVTTDGHGTARPLGAACDIGWDEAG